MAVQVSYPGVYVEEFAPGAPISGVGTGTAALLGTAVSGPVGTPTRVQSWDAFVATFGGFPTSGPPSHLAGGVYGFFRNGGTDCYVVRVATGGPASAGLDSRQSGGSPAEPVIVATARVEGPAGNTVTVEVAESSRLASSLLRAAPPAPGAKPDPAAGQLAVHAATTTVAAVAGPTTLTVDAAGGFAVGDRVNIQSGKGKPIAAIVQSVRGDTVGLAAPLPASVTAGATVRTADLVAGQTVLRVDVPAGVSLSQALPAGSLVSISAGSASEVGLVATTGGDVITLTEGLGSSYAVPDAAGAPRIASLEFDLIVTDAATGRSERFGELSTSPRHPAYWGSAVTSALVGLAAPPAPPSPEPDDIRPAVGTYPLTGGLADDRAAAWADLLTRTPDYLDLLLPVAEIDIVAVPGATDTAVQQAIVAHCEATFDRFAILDAAPNSDPDAVQAQFAGVASAQGFAALYYPWLTVAHPVTGAIETWPPSGHVAGIFAHTDATRGVHKAPANVAVVGALGVERRLTDVEQGPLNLAGVNALRVFPGQTRPVVWGARTTAGDLDRNWQYVNVRRLFLFLEQSISQGIRWAVFEPNDISLWQRLKRTIDDFLTTVWRDGALFGATADQAFYVRIDEVLNPPSSRALGRLVIEVGVAPTYPAEFVVLRIGIWQGGSSVAEG